MAYPANHERGYAMTRKRKTYHRTRPNTRGRRKYQCTAPAAWGALLKRAARRELGRRYTESDGVSMALEIGVRVLAERLGVAMTDVPHASGALPDQIPLPWGEPQ